MKQRWFFFYTCMILLLLTNCGDPSLPADSTQYQVIFRESEAGVYTKQHVGPRENTYYFTFTDRGRGPEYQESISLDEQGFIREQSIQGHNYRKVSIEEQFSVRGETATTINPLGKKEGAFPGRQLYFRFDGSPAVYEVLANLLQASEAKKVPLYPEGEAELIGSVPLTIAGLDVRLLLVNGLDINPAYIWMEEEELIARLEGNLHVVRNDLLGARQEMKAIQDSLENDYLFQKTRQYTHEYARVLIKNVELFSPRGEVVPRQDVLVDGGRIASIAPAGQVSADADLPTLDGAGKLLIPGMFDMHTHNSKFNGLLHIAGGVTSVRDLANNKQLVDLRDQFDRNAIIGPRIVYMCGIIDGPGPYANQRNAINTLEEGLAEIQSYKDLGYQQIKIYSSIKPEWVEPLAARSHELGMKVSGHIPAFMTASQAIEQGFDEIQHINMLFLNFQSDTIDTRTPLRFTMVAQHGGKLDLESAEYLDFAKALLSKGIIVDPTVSIFEDMFVAQRGVPSPTYAMISDRFPIMSQRDFLAGGLPKSGTDVATYQAAFDKMLDVIDDLYQRGVPIVPGTDGLPGFLYHRELELYQKSGIPAAEVLRLATLESARIAGVDQLLGSIEVGKLADLVLIDGDPLNDISDIRKVEWVMKDGKLFYPEEIYGSMGIQHYR